MKTVGISSGLCKLLAMVVLFHASHASAKEAGEVSLLHAMFQEHAVLQRDQPIRIWGTATPNTKIQLELGTHRANTRTDQAGAWEVLLPSMPAGGPHTLTVSDGVSTQSVGDLLVGDVWLCSGQSNMELPVWRTLDAASELGSASAPTIRLLTIPQSASPVPLPTFPSATQWQAVDADSLREFSAACFYFARELQKKIDVPMGLIDASWGGSRIQAWIDGEALKTDPRYQESLEVLALYEKDPLAAARRWGEVWGKWWEQRAGTVAGDRPWSPSDQSESEWRKAPGELGLWEHWNDPALADYNGMVWFRTAVELTPDQARQKAVLELAALDETDITWVNGVAVGSEYGPGSARRYPLPAGGLKAGENKVVVNVLDTWRDGGMNAPAAAYRVVFEDGSSVALGHWEYRVSGGAGYPPGAPWQSTGGVSTLHNGMIAPLGRYGVRGVLWYQGESNTGEAAEYSDLLRRLGTGLRTRFGSDLPILLVQLAGFGMPATQPGESGWASLREAQRAVADENPHTALAIALDIGDRYDIHPPNKQELGRRLARAARQLVYGEALPASGPVPLSATRKDDAVVVRFGDVDGALLAYGASAPVGFELCGHAIDSCHYANGEIHGSEVVLRITASVDATRVRYGWADNPVVNLFDGAGLPAGPFEIPIGEGNP